MSLSRSQLSRGPAQVTYNSGTFFSESDITTRHAPSWVAVMTSLYGEVDEVRKDMLIHNRIRLWGAWENIATLLPTAYLNPTVGASVFGNSDSPLVLVARNGDQVTYPNTQIFGMSNLRLGVDENIFSADVDFLSLIKNSANPEDDGAYFTTATGQTFTESAFAKTNFKRVRFSAAWGSKTGYTSFISQDGFRVDWQLQMSPLVCDGLGTVDMTLDGLVAVCRCIPIGPTLAQQEAQAHLGGASGSGVAHGALLSTNAADLTLTGTGVSVVLKNAGIIESGYVWGREKLRMGEVAFKTTRGFTAGVPVAVATAS